MNKIASCPRGRRCMLHAEVIISKKWRWAWWQIGNRDNGDITCMRGHSIRFPAGFVHDARRNRSGLRLRAPCIQPQKFPYVKTVLTGRECLTPWDHLEYNSPIIQRQLIQGSFMTRPIYVCKLIASTYIARASWRKAQTINNNHLPATSFTWVLYDLNLF